MRKLIVGVAAILALRLGPALAGDYPDKTITLVTPYAVGGGSDLLTRVLAEGLAKALGGSVIVQNSVGAGSIIGSTQVADANPNGYTLLLNHVGMATAPALYRHLKFDPVKSFAPVGMFAETPMAIVAAPAFPPNNMTELVAYVRAHPNEVSIASSGMGSATHLCAMLFQQAVGTNVTIAQYKGSGPALLDVQAGRVNLLCDVTASISAHIKAKDVKAYVITSEKRLPSLPDLPTGAEVGMPTLNVTAWYGLYAPAATPQPIIERLSAALKTATQDATVDKQLKLMDSTAFDPSQATPDALREKLSAQIALWGPVVTAALKDASKNPN
jgi:tripartite-type tricarboxylate transporter receptor subunit TctC